MILIIDILIINMFVYQPINYISFDNCMSRFFFHQNIVVKGTIKQLCTRTLMSRTSELNDYLLKFKKRIITKLEYYQLKFTY